MRDDYRKNARPRAAPLNQWPYSNPPSNPNHPPASPRWDDVDDAIYAMERGARSREAWKTVGRIFFAVCFLAMIVGVVVAAASIAEQEKTDCLDRGGRVEEIHNSRDIGAWICVGGR